MDYLYAQIWRKASSNRCLEVIRRKFWVCFWVKIVPHQKWCAKFVTLYIPLHSCYITWLRHGVDTSPHMRVHAVRFGSWAMGPSWFLFVETWTEPGFLFKNPNKTGRDFHFRFCVPISIHWNSQIHILNLVFPLQISFLANFSHLSIGLYVCLLPT